ncbi:MAG: ADP-dependent glucokinase/phosphofructokinase [Flexilinea sp.]
MGEKIVLGLGDNIDYEIKWDSGIFENLIRKYDIKSEELSKNIVILNERDLVTSILNYLQNEKGGECFVHSPQIIENFSNYFIKKITLGGTPVRAAIAMSKIGYSSAVHLVTINDDVRKLLPEDCSYICSADKEASYPHLIIQYCSGTKIDSGKIHICTHRANRIIYDNDPENILMKLSPKLGDFISKAGVFLLSGFNAMQSKDLLNDRLNELDQVMRNLPDCAIVFYEDSCFYNKNFSELIRQKLLKFIDIYSLNEDEFQEYLGRKAELLDPEKMLEDLAAVYSLIPVSALIVHTRFWALAYGENAESYQKALKGGITMAGTRFRFGDSFTILDYQDTETVKLQEQGVKFSTAINKLSHGKVCCLGCIEAEESSATTIGLGDAFVGGFLPALVS